MIRLLICTLVCSGGLALASLSSASACDCQGKPQLTPTPNAKGHLVGTKEADCIVGTPNDDIIVGKGGDDVLCGEGGNDQLRGGQGNDRLFGGEGDDDLQGNKGDDHLDGGPGNDILRAGPGKHTLLGGPGLDFIATQNKGTDTIDAGAGIDRILVRGAGHVLRCSAGVDVLFGRDAQALADSHAPCEPIVARDGATAVQHQLPGAAPNIQCSDRYTATLASHGDSKLRAIKLARTRLGLDLRAAKALVDSVPVELKAGLDEAAANETKQAWEALGAEVRLVKTSACGSIATPEPTGTPAEPEAHFSVVLQSYGAKKLSVIKVVRSVTGLGLKASKVLVESAPTTIKEGMPRAEAESLKTALEQAGAQVEIR